MGDLDRLRAAINALGALRTLSAAHRDLSARLPDSDRLTAMAHAGLVRSIDHYLIAEVHEPKPDWRFVRALHAAWVAAKAYDCEVSRG